jgi:hypothetical protein
MHPAANPFVIGEYARKTKLKQCQLFRRYNKLSAFVILFGLPLKMGYRRKTGALRMPIGMTTKVERGELNGTERMATTTT